MCLLGKDEGMERELPLSIPSICRFRGEAGKLQISL
jgi:hypothetical protein